MPYRIPGDSSVFVDHAGTSMAGHLHDVNEDAWAAIERVSVFVVADGVSAGTSGPMSGTTPARLAADVAVKTFRRVFDSPHVRDAQKFLIDPLAIAALEAHEQVMAQARGATASIAAMRIDPPWIVSLAVGNARVYRWRDRGGVAADQMPLVRVTTGHELAIDLLKRGSSYAEIKGTIERYGEGIATRSLGHEAEPLDVELTVAPLVDGDIYLLCTDGVSGPMGDGEIAAILQDRSDPDRTLADICDVIVATANARGRGDNVTCLMVQLRAHFIPPSR
jgi:PPM family protein phosphatase